MKYTKVIIKSDSDLPKETGGYFVFDKAFSFQSDYFNNDDKFENSLTITNIPGALLP